MKLSHSIVKIGIGAATLLLPLLSSAAGPPLHILTTPDGIRIGWLGDKPSSPRPTVFFLGGAIEEDFDAPHYQEAVEALGPGVLKVAVDLPGHGPLKRAEEPGSIRAWRYRLDHDEDFVADFTSRATKALNYLVESKLSDPAKIGVFGTSRGGFMALHFAAADARVRAVTGFAPVTDLLILTEFAAMKNDRPARALSSLRLADRVCDRALWMVIGSTDDRVGTLSTMEFTERIIESARARNMAPNIELHVRPADGHTTPKGSYGAAARWLLELWQ